MKSVIINLYYSNIKLQYISSYKDKSILIFLEEKKVYINNQCRQGFCGFCKIPIISGMVTYIMEPLAFFKKDTEILSCCCIAKTDIILSI